MKSPVKYLTDTQYTALTPWERSLHVAKSQLGVEEVPRGSNWGLKVCGYIFAAGLKSPVFWCACFVTWCLREAQWTGKLPKNKASTYFWYAFAKENGVLHKTPKRGDLFVWNNASGGHIGFVLEVQDGKIRTIEGNSNSGGSRNGYAVVERWRSVAELQKNTRWGFIRLSEVK